MTDANKSKQATPPEPRQALAPAHGSAYARRKARAEAQVIAQIKEHGGFSVFWATESMERSRAIDRLHWKLGVISPKKGRGAGRFPWCGYKLISPNRLSSPTAADGSSGAQPKESNAK